MMIHPETLAPWGMRPRARMALEALVVAGTVVVVGYLFLVHLQGRGYPVVLVLSSIVAFVGLVLYRLAQGNRAWFTNLAITRAQAVENKEWDEEVAEGVVGQPRPCWRCGGLAPADASECPACGASLT